MTFSPINPFLLNDPSSLSHSSAGVGGGMRQALRSWAAPKLPPAGASLSEWPPS